MRNFNTIRTKTIALALTGALGATAACGETASPTDKANSSPASHSATASATSGPGYNPNTMPFPGRVALPTATCETWSVNNPQPAVVRNGKLLTVVDARRSYPPNCNYLTDSGTGTYQGASYEAETQTRADGSTHVPDGTVVRVTSYSLGQFACNPGGGSNLWVAYTESPEGTPYWSPVINLGGAPTLEMLEQAQIPELASSYNGTRAKGC